MFAITTPSQLYAVLLPMCIAGPHLTNVLLPSGPHGRSMQVDVITCILFVIQHMQEGNMLCGHFGSCCGKGIQQQHCCACDVNHEQLDNPYVQCTC